MRLDIVLRNALAAGIRDAEIVLREGVALLSRTSIQPHSFNVVLRNAQAFFVRFREMFYAHFSAACFERDGLQRVK